MRDAIGRALLFPALHQARAQMRRHPEPQTLRRMAARADAMGRLPPDLRTEAVMAGSAPATWFQLKGVRRERVVLYLHGGAFVVETPRFHGALLARICREACARGLMVNYRLAPEHQYPAALDDCMAAYRWLLEQGHEPGRILVAGDSAGGNLTLALLLRLRDEGLPLPAGAVALSPVTDLSFSGDSIRRNDGIDDMFSADTVASVTPAYLAQPERCREPLVSPHFGDFSGLPPLLLLVGSTELLLDDSVRLAQRWPGAELLVWHGMPHVFPGFDFLPEARAATARIGRFMRDCAPVKAEEEAAAETAAPAADAWAASAPGLVAAPPPTTSIEAWLYGALAFVTGWLSLALLALWPGPLALLTNPWIWAATAVAVTFMVMEAASVGARRLAGCLLAALGLGPGFGLALFLFLRARRRDRLKPLPPD